MILRDTKLRNELYELSKKYKDIEDIILFGSVVRGKDKPKDIDVLVIFKLRIDKEIELKIRKIIQEKYNNLSIISKTSKTVLDPSFDARESILFEGISLLSVENVAQKYGYSPIGMFKYVFPKWNNLQKTKFYHALNGRKGGKGIAQKLNSIKIADNLIIVPLDKIEEFKSFLEFWNLQYVYIPTLIPERLNKNKILS